MSNPVLSQRSLERAAGWAAPAGQLPVSGSLGVERVGVFSIAGATTATGVLALMLVASAVVSWSMFSTLPGLVLVGVVIAALICALVVSFHPMRARLLAPVYALLEGFALGVISKMYEARYDGIVLQAVAATCAVFVVMLALYRLRVIRVTNRFKTVLLSAFGGVFLVYLVSLVVSLFSPSSSLNLVRSTGVLGVGFSIVVTLVAAFGLALDFDVFERGAREGWPKQLEWFAAFGLLVSLVWLYLELLRLFSKLQSRS